MINEVLSYGLRLTLFCKLQVVFTMQVTGLILQVTSHLVFPLFFENYHGILQSYSKFSGSSSQSAVKGGCTQLVILVMLGH